MYILVSRQYTEGDAHNTVVRLLELAHPPDAVIAAGDVMLGALLGLRDRGVRIPDDVAFVAAGDIHWRSLAEPALSTIEVNGEEFGRITMQMALERLDRNLTLPPQRIVQLSVRFVRRGSS